MQGQGYTFNKAVDGALPEEAAAKDVRVTVVQKK